MGWNDHHPGIDPADPDPGRTLREQCLQPRTDLYPISSVTPEPPINDCPQCYGTGVEDGELCCVCGGRPNKRRTR